MRDNIKIQEGPKDPQVLTVKIKWQSDTDCHFMLYVILKG
jgi:hypothetical protein